MGAVGGHGADLRALSDFTAMGKLGVGVFAKIFVELAQPGSDGDMIMIDSTHLKAHRTAASLSKGGSGRGPSDVPKAG